MSRTTEYRGWYQTPEWTALSKLVRSEEPLCRECKKANTLTPTECIDHIIPHRGDWDKFIDRDNLQSLCARCHNRKSRQEQLAMGINVG